MSNPIYKGYWMVTNRCNFRCSYCVLENAPHQLKAELDLEEKKALISHLYELGFRQLTLSGGEVLIIGKKPPSDFIALLDHIRQFRSDDPEKNLEIEVYTNGTYLDEEVATAMAGVVDRVAITIDSTDPEFLLEIGRGNKKFDRYYDNAISSFRALAGKGIELKIHSVVFTRNHEDLPEQVEAILDSIERVGAKLFCWKFYQYMSYDAPEKDQAHAIPPRDYDRFRERTEAALKGRDVRLHFKDNEEMNASLFNILSYGNAQYMRNDDSWSTSPRTRDLREYASMSDLFSQHDIDEQRFRQFHEIRR